MSKLELLKGMKVIDMASFVAGPTCAKILAEYGADVIRIEALVGDDKTRDLGKNAMGIKNGDLPLYDLVNGNKKQLALDTRRPEGLAILRKLLETADVFVCHLRQANMQRLGLDWETLHRDYPGLIYANVTGYGTKGSYADRGGFDSVAYVSRAGVHFAAEREGTKPYMPFAGQGDLPTGCYLAMGVMAAYINKLRTGVGDMVTANLYGAGIWAGAFPIITAQEPYNVPWPKDPMDTFSPLYNIYKCADGHWVTICGNGWPWEKFVHRAGWDESWYTNYPGMIDAYMNGRKLSEEMERWIAALQAIVASLAVNSSNASLEPSAVRWSSISRNSSSSVIPRRLDGTALILYSLPPKGSISKPKSRKYFSFAFNRFSSSRLSETISGGLTY